MNWSSDTSSKFGRLVRVRLLCISTKWRYLTAERFSSQRLFRRHYSRGGLTLSFLLCLNSPFYLPTMSPLTPESINSGFIIPPYDHRLSYASSSASNIQPINTDVDSCYSRFVRSFAGSASLFPNSRLLPNPRPIARSTLERQEPSTSQTPSFHMDKDVSAMTQPPVSIKLHSELLITGEPRGDAKEVSRVSGWTIRIENEPDWL